MKLDHIGIAVHNIDEALKLYQTLGFTVLERGQVEAYSVDVCMLDTGNSKLELIAPTGPGATQNFLDKKGPGLHHMAFAVDDIKTTLIQYKADGLQLIDEQPRAGFGGHLVAFVHPKSTQGALIELVQA